MNDEAQKQAELIVRAWILTHGPLTPEVAIDLIAAAIRDEVARCESPVLCGHTG